jgi:hypothetical protein
MPRARITGRPHRKRSTPNGKLMQERCVCAPPNDRSEPELLLTRPPRSGTDWSIRWLPFQDLRPLLQAAWIPIWTFDSGCAGSIAFSPFHCLVSRQNRNRGGERDPLLRQRVSQESRPGVGWGRTRSFGVRGPRAWRRSLAHYTIAHTSPTGRLGWRLLCEIAAAKQPCGIDDAGRPIAGSKRLGNRALDSLRPCVRQGFLCRARDGCGPGDSRRCTRS